jgi:phenylalanyl-tRNA synthetase alpha chain
MIEYEFHENLAYALTPEGSQIAQQGSHESRVWNALPLKGSGKGLTAKELKDLLGDETAKIGQNRGFKSGWIGKEGDTFVKLVCRIMMSI